MTVATIEALSQADGVQVRLSGDWTLVTLPPPISGLELRLRDLAAGNAYWDLQAIERMDSAGAILLWRAWGRQWPASLAVSLAHRSLLERVEAIRADRRTGAAERILGLDSPAWRRNFGGHRPSCRDARPDWPNAPGCRASGAHPGDIPWREFSANLYKSGAQALPVTALIGFLIGIVLSYLSALQLATFGADVFIVNLLGISIVRELGPVLVAVLVAGRSGSAMTAQIGVMRVTEEIDALATMGVSRSLRLVLPKVLALALAMPLLVIWCSAAGIVGGMVAAKLQMDLSFGFFIDTLPKVVPVANVWIGLGKGAVFGVLIALIACHFGLRVKPNTESLSSRTTTSVVTSITVAILVDAVFAVLTRGVGLP
jgi:phospholipid/cholesterol/gamma-HCH transport system permease protein